MGRMKPSVPERASHKLFLGITTFGIFVFLLLIRFYSPTFPPTLQGVSLRHFITPRHNDTVAYWSAKNKTNNSEQKVTSPRRSLIVNTTTCKIPNFDPWDQSIHLMKCYDGGDTDPACQDRGGASGRKWMHLQGSTLLFNDSELHGSKYSKSSLRCCYYVIHRKEQSLAHFNYKADKVVQLLKSCRPLSLDNANNISDEFFKVLCKTNNSVGAEAVIYKEYFALAQPDAHAQSKILRWNALRAKDPEGDFPPNVVILGIDGNSRLNSHRRLPRTLEVLEKLDAVELLGYTKVGDNTLPNTIPFLTGMTADDLLRQCYPHRRGSFDGCPLIWKDFDRAGYLTATAEDAPKSTSFNYYRHGFVVKPVDFYYRPFILASSSSKWNLKCVGHHSTMELLLNYLDDILRRGSQGAPVFIHSWASFYSHDCIHSLRFADDTIANFVERMDKENTILVMMSDHGYRIGQFRESTMGWYEDRLPSMWISLPDRVRKRWPQWQENLRVNAERLTSHFDLYHTFVHILQSYKVDPHFHVRTPSPPKGQSLLELVPENRTCSQAGIPEGYYACSEPKPIILSKADQETKALMELVANAGLSYLAKALPEECVKFGVRKIISGKRMELPDGKEMFVVTFYTKPGSYLFEVTSSPRLITLNGGGGKESQNISVEGFDSIARVSAFNWHNNCVQDAIVEKYCYCS